MRRETDFVLEKAAWPTMLLEAGGGICRANQAARRLFGLTDDLPATALPAFWDDENTTSAVNFLQQQTEGETAPLKLRLHDGQKSQFIAHVAKVARDGQEYFVLQLFKESGAAFAELAYMPVPKAAGKIPSGLMQAAWPALVVDPQGKIMQANPSAVRVFGAKAAAAGAALAGICPPEEADALGKLLQPAPQTPAAPFKICQADGSAAPFRIEPCPAGDSKWILLQFFRVERQSEPPAPAPPEKNDEDFLLQGAEWPVLLVHKNGKVLRANRAGVRAFGASIEREEAQLEAIWSPHNRDTCQQFLNLPPPAEPVPLKFHLKSGLPGDYWGQICGTGQEDVFLLQLLKGPPPGTGTVGEPRPAPAVVAAAVDTARGGVEASLAHKQKLDCALQLARSVALDFNNALTSILGHASLLLSKIESDNPLRNSLVEIEKSAAKAAEIANDLAVFSRQEKDVRAQVAGNLNMLLERTVEMFQGTTQSAIAISRQLERKLFTANFDEAKMLQAMVKIFENAVESIKGDGKINVQTRNLELTETTQDRTAKLNPGNYVCVEISDTGSGIADDVMPHIFEPFFSTKGARHRGLGLAWVYGIVTNHGGGVAVSSQPDIGTTVRLYLPANRKIVRDAPMADGDLTGTGTILFVDDEDLVLTMAQAVLSSYGYTVLTANSGQKALELFTRSKKKIDLVITDLVMPNMSGRELSDHLLRVAPETRIICSSGYVRSANAEEQERYLQKPFSAQDLLRKVKQVLAQGHTDIIHKKDTV
jgi:signal transduction histidine kinase/CheY-like chemotaxis protein/PAS domain-containing protein